MADQETSNRLRRVLEKIRSTLNDTQDIDQLVQARPEWNILIAASLRDSLDDEQLANSYARLHSESEKAAEVDSIVQSVADWQRTGYNTIPTNVLDKTWTNKKEGKGFRVMAAKYGFVAIAAFVSLLTDRPENPSVYVPALGAFKADYILKQRKKAVDTLNATARVTATDDSQQREEERLQKLAQLHREDAEETKKRDDDAEKQRQEREETEQRRMEAENRARQEQKQAVDRGALAIQQEREKRALLQNKDTGDRNAGKTAFGYITSGLQQLAISLSSPSPQPPPRPSSPIPSVPDDSPDLDRPPPLSPDGSAMSGLSAPVVQPPQQLAFAMLVLLS